MCVCALVCLCAFMYVGIFPCASVCVRAYVRVHFFVCVCMCVWGVVDIRGCKVYVFINFICQRRCRVFEASYVNNNTVKNCLPRNRHFSKVISTIFHGPDYIMIPDISWLLTVTSNFTSLIVVP